MWKKKEIIYIGERAVCRCVLQNIHKYSHNITRLLQRTQHSLLFFCCCEYRELSNEKPNCQMCIIICQKPILSIVNLVRERQVRNESTLNVGFNGSLRNIGYVIAYLLLQMTYIIHISKFQSPSLSLFFSLVHIMTM